MQRPEGILQLSGVLGLLREGPRRPEDQSRRAILHLDLLRPVDDRAASRRVPQVSAQRRIEQADGEPAAPRHGRQYPLRAGPDVKGMEAGGQRQAPAETPPLRPADRLDRAGPSPAARPNRPRAESSANAALLQRHGQAVAGEGRDRRAGVADPDGARRSAAPGAERGGADADRGRIALPPRAPFPPASGSRPAPVSVIQDQGEAARRMALRRKQAAEIDAAVLDPGESGRKRLVRDADLEVVGEARARASALSGPSRREAIRN